MPLSLRRDKLALQYITKLKSNDANPTYDCVFNPKYQLQFDSRPHIIPTLGLRLKEKLDETGIQLHTIARFSYPTIPLWTIRSAIFVYDLHNIGKKADTQPDLYIAKYHELQSILSDYTKIFTDGSKDGSLVAAAAVSIATNLSSRLPDNASIFSAEAYAILLATDIIKSSAGSNFVIFSDSLSCLQAIQNRLWDNPIILNILNSLHTLITAGTSIIFVWLPSHVGIKGNSRADTAAKAALSLQISKREVPHTDFKPLINSYLRTKWQHSWDLEVLNKLHAIKSHLGNTTFGSHLSRRDERVLHRLRIGHTHLTHAHLLKSEDQPECVTCQSPLTVEHILLRCVDFNHLRPNYFIVASLYELFDTVPPKCILDFVKAIGLYHKF